MQTRSRTIIAAGVLVAMLGALTVLAYAKRVEGRSGGGPQASAYVATTEIPAGTKWEDVARALREQRVPATLRPSTAVAGLEQLTGRTSVRAIAQGEIVTTTQFGASSQTPAGGLEIPPGHNAVSLNLPAPQGVGRYPQPGDLVNVYVTFKGGVPGKAAAQPITKLVLSNVQVLANVPAGAKQAAGDALLTLALTPPDAETLVFAKENGSLWFGLVRPGDPPASTGGRTIDSVL